MTKQAEKLLAAARQHIDRGEEFYRKAAEEIVAAMAADPTLSYREIGERIGKAKDYARRLVTSYTSGALARGEGVDWGRGSGWPETGAKKILQDADVETLSSVMASLPPARVEAVAKAAHDAQLKNIRKTAGDTEPTLTDGDYTAARERLADVRASSTIEMQEFFTAFSRLRVRGIENVINNATATERRQWADRLIEVSDYALLGHDLCKTQKLEAVR